MSARRTLTAGLASLALAAGLAVIPAMSASATVTECDALSGAWVDATQTCTITTDVTVPGGNLTGNLVIASTGSLTTTANTGNNITGTLTIAGTFTISAGGYGVGGGTEIVGAGTLNVNGGGNVGGSVTVNGPTALFATNFSSVGGPVIVTDGTFNSFASTLSGDLTNADTVINGGSVVGATVSNGGNFTNSVGTLNGVVTVNGGIFTNAANILTPVTVNAGTFANSSNFSRVDGTLTIATGVTATNSGLLGTVVNAGTLTNNTGSNSGAVTNTGTGSLVNDGTITGGVVHNSTGTFTGTGTTTPKYAQTVAFSTAAPSPAAIGGTYVTATTGTAVGTAVSLSAGPVGVCSIAGSTVSFDGAGTCTVTAARATNGNFAAASADQVIPVPGEPQTVSFTSAAPTAAKVGGSDTLSATATSGGPITFSSLTTAVCSVSGSTVSYLAAGTCEIAADQAGNAQYASARATQSFSVASATVAGGGLANTGSTPWAALIVAFLALGLGGTVLVARRLRAQTGV